VPKHYIIYITLHYYGILQLVLYIGCLLLLSLHAFVWSDFKIIVHMIHSKQLSITKSVLLYKLHLSGQWSTKEIDYLLVYDRATLAPDPMPVLAAKCWDNKQQPVHNTGTV